MRTSVSYRVVWAALGICLIVGGCCQSRPIEPGLSIRVEAAGSDLAGRTISIDFAIAPRSQAAALEAVPSKEYFGGGHPLREAYAVKDLRRKVLVGADGSSTSVQVQPGDPRWTQWIQGGWDKKDPCVLVAISQLPGMEAATAEVSLDACSWAGSKDLSFDLVITPDGLRFEPHPRAK